MQINRQPSLLLGVLNIHILCHHYYRFLVYKKVSCSGDNYHLDRAPQSSQIKKKKSIHYFHESHFISITFLLSDDGSNGFVFKKAHTIEQTISIKDEIFRLKCVYQ